MEPLDVIRKAWTHRRRLAYINQIALAIDVVLIFIIIIFGSADIKKSLVDSKDIISNILWIHAILIGSYMGLATLAEQGNSVTSNIMKKIKPKEGE